ncbi:MAG TPA: hypothetical protein VGC42_22920 [Kofleriaceae bacterium]
MLGLGDLGRRLALGIAGSFDDVELIVAGRNAADGERFAALAAACGAARRRLTVRFVRVDGLQVEDVAAVLRRARPELIIQCATLLSPWALGQTPSEASRALAAAGFGLQLPAQLPVLRAVMTAARATGFAGPVINASYPDVTHPVLAPLGLAPAVGIGNAGMIEATARATLQLQGRAGQVRVVAHHSHVSEAMTREVARQHAPVRPQIFVDDTREDALAMQGAPLAASSELNALTCAHGLRVIRALAPGGAPLPISAPGPLGLPGGWPVVLAGGRVALDLPAGLSREAALAANQAAAAGDGVERIADDGTVWFTQAAQRAVAAVSAELAAPLAPDDCLPRLALLRRLVGA